VSDGVMIAFLPADGGWCRQPLPHMTLVYAGQEENLRPGAFNELAKDALSIAQMFRAPFSLKVVGIDQFGEDTIENPKVDVLLLEKTPELERARKLVEGWNVSQHPFVAHSTLGPAGSAQGILPSSLVFDRVMVGWGPRHLVFGLGKYYPRESYPQEGY
jgi:2'-5' RNA ligase